MALPLKGRGDVVAWPSLEGEGTVLWSHVVVIAYFPSRTRSGTHLQGATPCHPEAKAEGSIPFWMRIAAIRFFVALRLPGR